MNKMIESEKVLEAKLGTELKKLGGWSIKLLPTFISGIPDRMCLLPGERIFFAEVKTTKQKARPLQLSIHRKLRKMGFRVEVIDTTEQIIKLLKDYEQVSTQ
jgi:hypothetical protein